MRWASSPRSRGLNQRVAWAAGLSALGGALLAASLGGALAWTLAVRQEDRRLLDHLSDFAFELAQADGSPQAIRQTLEEEQREIQATGLLLSIEAPQGGPPPGCRTLARGEPWRQCVVQRGTLLLVATSPLGALWAWFLQSSLALLLAVALVSLLAVAFSRAAARVATAPLDELSRAIAGIDPQHPSADAIRSPSPCAEVEQLRRQVEALLVQLTASLGHARQFAFNAAHEWRTPLAALRAEVELLREEEASAPLTLPLGRIERHTLELIDRLERVLVLATPVSELQGEPVSMEATAQEVVAALDPERAARVEIVGEEGLVLGDVSLLKMMLRNAVDNALKFSKQKVRVRIENDHRSVSTFVEDDGDGLDPEEQDSLFQPFFRGRKAQKASIPGSGLGLALIAHIAHLHRGHARFDPSRRGACLRLSLPTWETSASSPQPTNQPEPT